MKKILTVLLALSVVFTYTVGTAFAATSASDADTKVAAAQKEAKSTADKALATVAYANGYIAYVGDTAATAEAKTVSKTAVDEVAAELQNEINAKLRAAGDEAILDDGKNLDTEISSIKEAYYKDEATYLKKLFDYVEDAYTYEKVLIKQASIDKAAALAKLDAVDPSLYYESDRATVENAVKTAKDAINKLTGQKGDVAAIKTAMDAFDSAMASLKTIADTEKELAEYKTAKVQEIESAAAEFKGDSSKGEIKRLSDIIASGTSTPAEIADAQAKLNMLDSNVASISVIYTTAINAVVVDSKTNLTAAKSAIDAEVTAAKAAFKDSTSFYKAVDKLGGVAYLKEYAANKAIQYKAELAADGTQKYYASTVDEALAEVNAKIEKLTATTVSEVNSAFTTALAGKTKAEIDAALTGKKTSAKSEIKSGSYASTNWDGERKAKVEAIQKEASAAIDAATNADAIDSIVKDAKAKMDAILKTATITTQKGYVDSEYENTYKALINGYVDTLIQKNGAQNYDAATQKDGMAAKVKEYYYNLVLAQENPKLTAAEVKTIMASNYSGALAVVEANLTTKAALEAAEKALIAQIDALNPVVSAENTAQVFAAYDAYLAYKQMNGSNDSKITNKTKLTLAVTKAVGIEKSAVEAKQTALLAKPALTVEDKAAVDALKAEIEAFNTKYAEYPGFSAITFNTALDTKIANALYQDAVEKINAIPEELTYADKETVEAARAAYDALSDAQKASLNASFKIKLENAEKQMEILAVKSVESLKIVKNHSTAGRTNGKSWIKIMWSTKGDDSAVQGYQVYKSAKKNSGYKYAFTSKAKWYKNTAGLKKGTRYYYKVRAIAEIDGQKYYSDWSNKAYRIAK